MRPALWLWLFLIAVAADLAAVYWQWNEVRYVSKPLIVLSLLIYFSKHTPVVPGITSWINAALLFSMAGDVCLLFEEHHPLFFMAGLGSFLLAHVFYIIAFRNIRRRQHLRSARWIWITGAVLYVAILLYGLMPYFGELKIPVVVYALVLCGMLLSVVHAFRHAYIKPGIICLAGAVLFVISDSLLAINKFYMGFAAAGMFIMLTYAFAQYLLVTGVSKALRSAQTANFAAHSTS
ncbi:MAG TPA: lysoplasmalogenase [Chitinophagaceae bacterium]|nr:lysoplasmalogenase [Chitinophagaceae bacterium]